MSWDVPVKDDCPVCGQTMFKKAGKGFKKPFCINPACANFLPEEKRGYPKKAAAEKADETAPAAEEKPVKKAAAKKPAAKTTAKKTTAAKKTTTAKKTSTAKTAAKKTAAKKAED